MAAERNEEVAISTNQPLISEDADNYEIETVFIVKNTKPDATTADVSSSHAEKDNICEECPKIKNSSNHHARTAKSLGPQDQNTPMAKSQSEIQVSVTNSLSISQTSKNSLMTFSSSGTFYDHTAAAKKKVDLRITPKRVQHSNGKGDATDFRQMEQGLLQLLEDFHSGKLEAFGQDCTFERMENVREQQERLARLHFDLNAQQELCGQHTEEGIKMAKRNLSKLTENLQELSLSIEKLQSGSITQADV